MIPNATQLIEQLRHVRTLRFTARTDASTGWNGIGTGSVSVEVAGPGVVLFHESGIWQPTAGGDLRFRNVYRWSLVAAQMVRLEHLRFGPTQPVQLFELVPESESIWASANPHVCRDDCYSARLRIGERNISLKWAITGPRKREGIEYNYGWCTGA